MRSVTVAGIIEVVEESTAIPNETHLEEFNKGRQESYEKQVRATHVSGYE